EASLKNEDQSEKVDFNFILKTIFLKLKNLLQEGEEVSFFCGLFVKAEEGFDFFYLNAGSMEYYFLKANQDLREEFKKSTPLSSRLKEDQLKSQKIPFKKSSRLILISPGIQKCIPSSKDLINQLKALQAE